MENGLAIALAGVTIAVVLLVIYVEQLRRRIDHLQHSAEMQNRINNEQIKFNGSLINRVSDIVKAVTR